MREVEDQGQLWPVLLSSKKYPLSREQVPFQNPEESELQVENVNMASKAYQYRQHNDYLPNPKRHTVFTSGLIVANNR